MGGVVTAKTYNGKLASNAWGLRIVLCFPTPYVENIGLQKKLKHLAKVDLFNHLDQLYAALPSDTKPSFPVDTVAFSKCRMFIEDLEDVTIIKMESQCLRKSCSINYHVYGRLSI